MSDGVQEQNVFLNNDNVAIINIFIFFTLSLLLVITE